MSDDAAQRWHPVPMLALTFSTGVVDAVGFLGLDRVFTGNMTGNVVILGMAIAGAAGLSVTGPLTALAAFFVGTAAGGRALRREPAGWTRRVTTLLAVVTTLLAGVGVVLLLLDSPSRLQVTAVTAVLALAMGLQASTARFIAVPEVSTVAVTNTLIGLGADSWFGADRAGNRRRRVLAIALIVAGATTGALLVRWHLGAGVLLAAGVAGLSTLAGTRYGERWRQRRSDGSLP